MPACLSALEEKPIERAKNIIEEEIIQDWRQRDNEGAVTLI